MEQRHPRPNIAGDRNSVAQEIDAFDAYLSRYQAGRVSDAVFLEHRLRHGVYGQRQDGVHMMRSKLPLGLLAPDQMEAFADIAERLGHGIAHLTTRQDIQVHFIELEQTPDLMRVLNDARMTSREACGNVVRNVVATAYSGVLPGEAFDVTAYGMALARYLLRIPDGQNLGRKFKIALSSVHDTRFNAGAFHDLGVTAVMGKNPATGRLDRGFRIVVGGGLGAVPHEATVLTEFIPTHELLPLAHAMLRVFGRHGEKHNRARARLKFLIARWGIERFRVELETERAQLQHQTAWSEIDAVWDDHPIHPAGGPLPQPQTPAHASWLRTSVLGQAQPGYATVKVRVPRGDLNPRQLRGLAALLRREVGDTTRIDIDQSLVIRWVSTDRLLALYDGLQELDLGQSRPGGLGDTVTCPGADTCKLGITSPRSLARHMSARLDALGDDPRLEGLRIHVSGCPNSCAQHQIADIGLFGAARTIDGITVPHFVLMLGGRPGGTAGQDTPLGSGFARTIMKLPASRIGEAIERIGNEFLAESDPEESFSEFAHRSGRGRFKALLADLAVLPDFATAPELYREYGKDDGSFQVRRGVGECAGEIVEVADLLLAEADGQADQAVDLAELDRPSDEIAPVAIRAMEKAARALLSLDGIVGPPDVVAAFRIHFYDAGRIFEGVGHYYLQASDEDPADIHAERLARLVVEAGLFVEEAHSIIGKLRAQSAVQGAAK